MANEDQQVECKERIKSAYQAMELYKKDMDKEFGRTVCALIEHMIVEVAESYNLHSDVRDIVEENSREHKKRLKRIEELEKNIGENLQNELFRKRIREVIKKINVRWNKEGFKGPTRFHLSETGNLHLTINLEPLKEGWDLEEELEDELPESYIQAFNGHSFDIIEEKGYMYLKDRDANRDKIETMLRNRFPSIRFWEYKRNYIDNIPVITGLECTINDLTCLEE